MYCVIAQYDVFVGPHSYSSTIDPVFLSCKVVQLLASTPISNLDIHHPMIIQELKVCQQQLYSFHCQKTNIYIYIYIKGSLLATLFITETCKILQAWGRLCKCLGQKFQPCMEVAIPCLLQSARLTLPDVANIEESDER